MSVLVSERSFEEAIGAFSSLMIRANCYTMMRRPIELKKDSEMNEAVVQPLLKQSLAKEITFPEILATLVAEGVESYHVDFLRNECRYYSQNGESVAVSVPFVHGAVAPELSAEKLHAINTRIQAGQATFADFVNEGAAAGCAYYIVYVNGRKVRYFGRDGGEFIQELQPSGKIRRSVIKSVDIGAPVGKVFDFLSDPLNWPRYAIVNLRSVKPGADGWYQTVTRFGEGQLKMKAVRELGILDHTWKDPQASWTVPARVVPNEGGSTVMMTLYQPPAMTDRQFDEAMREMDAEMSKLKEILEG